MPREKHHYVYIMASKSRVIYVGMTAFLMARVLRHRAGDGGTFTSNYRVHRLVPLRAVPQCKRRHRTGNGDEKVGGGKRSWL